MENTPFVSSVNLKDSLTDTSKLNLQIVYRSVALRDQLLKLFFCSGDKDGTQPNTGECRANHNNIL